MIAESEYDSIAQRIHHYRSPLVGEYQHKSIAWYRAHTGHVMNNITIVISNSSYSYQLHEQYISVISNFSSSLIDRFYSIA